MKFMKTPVSPAPSKKAYYLAFISITIIVIFTGYIIYLFRKDYIKKEKYNELKAIAELKTNQITKWRENLIDEGFIFSRNSFFISGVQSLIERKENLAFIKERLDVVKKYKDFSAAYILDTDLNCIVCDSPLVIDKKISLKNILNNKIPFLSGIYPNEDTTSFMIDLYIPLFFNNSPVGILIFKQNPDTYIYPLVQSWPTPSKTSETLIFQVEGDSLVYLNKLKHSNKNPFTFKLSTKDPDLPAAMLARGRTGIVEGIDYRGIPVLADLRKIPDTEWLLVTKVDHDEIFSTLTEQIAFLYLAGLIIISALGSGIALVWKNQKVKIFKQLYDSELERKKILYKFESVTKSANDIILLMTREGNITFANKKAEDIYGCSSDHLCKMNIRNLQVDKLSPDFDTIVSKAEKGEGVIFEAVHRKNNGVQFPVEGSTSVFEVEGKKYVQCIIRDITERKSFENEIQQSLKEKEILLKEIHHRVKNNLQIISSLLHLQTDLIDDEKIKNVFNDSSNRIKAIALVHQKLYTDRVEVVKAMDYIPHLVHLIRNTYDADNNRINIRTEISELELVIDYAVHIGLLINEIVTNSFKHAFPDNRRGNILITLNNDRNEKYQLKIKDDGIGLPMNYKSSLGMQLIFSIAEQIDGRVDIVREEGTTFLLTFKINRVDMQYPYNNFQNNLP